MNLYQEHIYRNSLQHGERRRNHKYLYIDSNGRYVYPEDVKSEARIHANAAKSMYKDAAAVNENAHRERAERVQAGNKRVAENAKKAIKSIDKDKVKKALSSLVMNGKYGRVVSAAKEVGKAGKNKIDEQSKKSKEREAALNKQYAEEVAKSNKEMSELLSKEASKYQKKQLEKNLPEGWRLGADGYIYDEIGAIVPDYEYPGNPTVKKATKVAKTVSSVKKKRKK